MATFNVAAALGKTAKSQDYGFLVDQLDILESQLKGQDGVLSSSDYQVLKGAAQKLYAHPGLTPAQRSNIEVKVASYDSSAKTNEFKKSGDLATIERDLQNNNIDNSTINGSNPVNFMKAKELSLLANLRQIENSIARLDNAGEDSSAHYNKRNALMEDLNNLNQAIEDTTKYQAGSQPTSNLRAYIKTNSKGQIVNIDVLPYGSKSGYVDTNRVYGGLIIAGAPNNKLPNGNVAFKLGNENLVASGSASFDPATGTFTNNNVLKPEAEGGVSNMGTATTYKSFADSGVTTQKTAYPNQYFKPTDSKFIYKMNADGNFTKYASTTPQNLGITENDLMPVSNDFESSNIVPYVKDTVMNGPELNLPTPPAGAPAPTASTTPPASTQQTGGTSRTKSATERSPQTSQGIVGKALDAAKGFFGKLFGQ